MSLSKEFKIWIDKINRQEKPDKNIIAFWFGLFESPKGFTMYLIGSKDFDEHDDDWASNNDFEPKQKYFELPADYVKENNWGSVLNDALGLLKDYISSEEFKSSIFCDATAIAVGFDDGDINRIK